MHIGTCTARAALAGNPSDGYGGAVLAVPVPDLTATVTTVGADSCSVRSPDGDLRALLTATVDAFADALGNRPAVTVTATTTIPRSVGLAGSSALVIATLRALGDCLDHVWDPVELATLALSVEVDRLGITAGLQDRLVQAVARPVLMRFDPVSFDPVSSGTPLRLFVAWDTAASAPSGAVHRPLRQRFDGGDRAVHEVMRELAAGAELAGRAFVDGDLELLGSLMDRTFDLRTRLVDVGPLQRRLVAIGRRCGAAVNSAGSGGSVIGLADDPASIETLRSAYLSAGAGFVDIPC